MINEDIALADDFYSLYHDAINAPRSKDRFIPGDNEYFSAFIEHMEANLESYGKYANQNQRQKAYLSELTRILEN